MPPKLGIIADDFTGALLIASELEAAGRHAPVFLAPAAIPARAAGDVIILGTRLRVAPQDEARAGLTAAIAALSHAGCSRIAYKACASFDSTETGNIGLAAEMLSEHHNGAPVLMSAGYPKFDCTVHHGHLFYRARLVSESVKRLDPLTPMHDPDLVRFLSHQTASAVRLLPHRALVQGAGPARAAWQALLAQGARHVLADTSDDRDAEITAELAVAGETVLVASDPAIIALALALSDARAAEARPAPAPQGMGAVLVGSVGPTASAQVAAFAARHPMILVDLLSPGSAAEVAAQALARVKGHEGPVGFATTTDAEGVQRCQEALGQTGAARRAEDILAALAVALRDAGVRRLVVSGGETSGAVVAALGITRLRALPAGPLGAGFCQAESPVRMSLFLKSGKLGSDDVLLRALDEMQAGSPTA